MSGIMSYKGAADAHDITVAQVRAAIEKGLFNVRTRRDGQSVGILMDQKYAEFSKDMLPDEPAGLPDDVIDTIKKSLDEEMNKPPPDENMRKFAVHEHYNDEPAVKSPRAEEPRRGQLDIDEIMKSLISNVHIDQSLPDDVLIEVRSIRERVVVKTDGQMLHFRDPIVQVVRRPLDHEKA